jgi:hypothetical protein
MRWRILVLDVDGSIAKQFESFKPQYSRLKKDDVDVVFFADNESLFKFALEDKWPDHIGLIYDGEPLLAGVANRSFFAMTYGDRVLDHFTINLVDYCAKTKEVAREFLYEFHRRFSYEFAYETDEISLEEKRALIDGWNK